MNSIRFVPEFHRLLSLPEPWHPLVRVINLPESVFLEDDVWKGFINRFYLWNNRYFISGVSLFKQTTPPFSDDGVVIYPALH